ncbi:MAG: hypothetical protein ABL958_10405 [Bdellovibrionia bacterium]
MKKLCVILTAVLAFGCAKKEEEKPAAPPVPTESVSVTTRSSALIGDATALKDAKHSLNSEATCFQTGLLIQKADLFDQDFILLSNSVKLHDSAVANLDSMKIELRRLSVYCQLPVATADEKVANDQFRTSLDRFIASLTAIHALGKQALIPELKPQLAQASSEDVGSGKYPAEWGFEVRKIMIHTPFIEMNLAKDSSGASCRTFAGLSFNASEIDRTLVGYKVVPAGLLALSNSLKAKTVALGDYCKGQTTKTKQFFDTMPFLKRDLKDIVKVASDLATLLP